MTGFSRLRFSALCAFGSVVALAVVGCDGPRGAATGSVGGVTQSAGSSGTIARARPPVAVFGTVVAEEIRTLTPGFAARVAEVLTREGRAVIRGETLIRLDMADYDRELEVLDRRRRRSELRISDFSDRLTYARSDEHDELVDARIALRGALDQLERSRADLRRNEQLVTESAVSRRVVDEARDRVADAERAEERAQLRLRATRDRLARTVSDLETELELERLELDALRRDIARLRSSADTDSVVRPYVVAPFDGIVADVVVRSGDQLGPGSVLVRVIDTESLIVSADLPEEFLRDVMSGAVARIVPLADRSRAYAGRVVEVARQARRVGNETVVTARVSIDDRDLFLLPGMNVDVSIEARQ